MRLAVLSVAVASGALWALLAYGLGHRAGYRQCERDAAEITRLVRSVRSAVPAGVEMRAVGIRHAHRPGLVLAHTLALADEGPGLRRGTGRMARARFPGRVLALPSRALSPGWRDVPAPAVAAIGGRT